MRLRTLLLETRVLLALRHSSGLPFPRTLQLDLILPKLTLMMRFTSCKISMINGTEVRRSKGNGRRDFVDTSKQFSQRRWRQHQRAP